jgi:AraC family transcriptional regulator
VPGTCEIYLSRMARSPTTERDCSATGGPDLETRVVTVMRHIERHLDRELSLDELARVAGLSAYHFHRVFRAVAGEAVMDYARRLRLEHAAYRLRSTRRSVGRVAAEVGYESPDAFGRAFRGRFGLSPSAFRRSHVTTTAPNMAADGPSHDTRARTGVRVIHRPPMRLVCLRHVGPYMDVWRTWRRLETWVVTSGLHVHIVETPEGSTTNADVWRPMRMGMSHDDPGLVPADRLRYDAAFVLKPGVVLADGPVGPAGDVRESAERSPDACAPHGTLASLGPAWLYDIPGGPYAVVTHCGPYHQLDDAYGRLYAWLPRSGREPADAPPLEWYRNEPRDVGPDSLLTDILLPLR